jgi:hypothetical protein
MLAPVFSVFFWVVFLAPVARIRGFLLNQARYCTEVIHSKGTAPTESSLFMKCVKAPKMLEEAARAWTMIPFFVLPFKLLVVLASSTSGDQHFCEIVTLCRPPPHQDWGRARTAGNRFARDDKKLGGPAVGSNYPENGLVKPPNVTHEPSAQPACPEERRRSA